MAGVKGLEPSTYRVTGDRSNQLSYTPVFWWAVKDSNLWPSRCKRDALPTELTALHTKILYLQQEIMKDNLNLREERDIGRTVFGANVVLAYSLSILCIGVLALRWLLIFYTRTLCGY